jgi:hypothetical protein
MVLLRKQRAAETAITGHLCRLISPFRLVADLDYPVAIDPLTSPPALQ